MKIKWFGHSCFLMTSEKGVKILTDPYNSMVGYKVPEVACDIVTISHNHFDHNNRKVAKGDHIVIDKPGNYVEKGIEIKGIHTYHDRNHGARKGDNIIYNFGIDGINICHCGDLGHVLSQEQLKEVGKVDVLLIPTSRLMTVGAHTALEVIGQLKPSITIPMHFGTKAMGVKSLLFGNVDKFLKIAQKGKRVNQQEVTLCQENLREYPEIMVLDYEAN